MSAFSDLFALLAAPIEPHLIEQRPGGRGLMLPYITARTVMDRLDQVVGPENWWDHFQVLNRGVLCALTIRLPNGELLTKEDAGAPAGMEDEGDNEKSAFSDALKRAAVKFGIGRYLETADAREPARTERPSQVPPPRQAPPAPARNHASHFPPPPEVPRTGREFYGWMKSMEAETGRSILKPVNARAKDKGFSGRTIDLSPAEVAELLPFAKELALDPRLPISE